MGTEERRQTMRPNDPEYKRKLDLISTIPSNKFDNPNLNVFTDEQMERFEEHSDRMLREQVRAYSDHEKEVIADELTKCGWTYVYNALGEYFDGLKKKQDATITINQQ